MYITSYVRKRGKYYHLVVELCKNKKRICKSRSSKTDSKENAERMLEQFEKECILFFNINLKQTKISNKEKIFKSLTDKITIDKNVTFCSFIKVYIEMRYKTVSNETYASYLSAIKNSIIPYFFKENKSIKDISVLDIQKFYHHELNLRNVSANTVIHFHNILSLVFKYALKIGIIEKNPILLVDKPKKEKYVAKTYTIEEIKQLLELLKNKYSFVTYAIIFITLQYGLRRSEILGLKWDSIDFEENILKITSTVTQTNIDGKELITYRNKTKSIAGMRSFYLTEKTKEILLEIKEQQASNKIKFGTSYSKKFLEFIFVNQVGEIIKPKSLSNSFAKILKKNNLRYIRFHDLRHSAATLLYQSNISVKDIQTFMGHTSVKTTMDIYVHLQNKTNTSTVSTIEKLI